MGNPLSGSPIPRLSGTSHPWAVSRFSTSRSRSVAQRTADVGSLHQLKGSLSASALTVVHISTRQQPYWLHFFLRPYCSHRQLLLKPGAQTTPVLRQRLALGLSTAEARYLGQRFCVQCKVLCCGRETQADFLVEVLFPERTLGFLL